MQKERHVVPTISWASGTNKTSLCPLWEEMVSVGGDCARTDTFAGADHRGKWVSFLTLGRNKHLKYSYRVNEKPSHHLTRGREDEAQRLIHSWHDSLVTQVMRGVAEGVVGRESKTNDMPCLRACRNEVLSETRVAESYARLQNARQTEDFASESESERHRRVKRSERDSEREHWKEAVATICAELESAYENHETGKQYRLHRELGVNLRDDDYSGTEAITPEACRQHFLKISGEPNEPLLK